MKKKIFALVDCNNFYASCERVFRPDLEKRPIVVLSNNDGCVIARSNEVKKMGIPMGEPFFKCKSLLKRNNVEVFSSNYSLYGDMSKRVMKILSEYSPDIEIYSIDEAFIDLSGLTKEKISKFTLFLKNKIKVSTGIPVSIGIAETKTLAKVANHVAKNVERFNGIFNFYHLSDENKGYVLRKTEIGEIWGIGRKSKYKLNQRGIFNALELRDSDIKWIRKLLTVTGEITVKELKGIPCVQFEHGTLSKKSITSSRSFGNKISSLSDLKQAVSSFVCIASEKLRTQKSAAMSICVYISTGTHSENRYYNSYSINLLTPSSYTPKFINAAFKALEIIYKEDFFYKKAGIILYDIVNNRNIQQDLFRKDIDNVGEKAMNTVDYLNKKHGKNTVFFGIQGINRKWKQNKLMCSPKYTTSWNELLTINI